MKKLASWSVLRWLICLNIAIALTYLALLFVAAQQGLLWRADFTAYYTGAVLVREGHGARLYDLEMQTQIQQRILGERSFYGGVLPYNYPPYFALLLLPLTYLTLPQAFAAWTVASLGGLLWVIRLLNAETRSWIRRDRWVLVSVVLALPALMRSILQGTSSVFALLSMLLVYRTLKGNDLVSGTGGLVAGTIRPQSILPIGLFVVLQRQWRLLGAAALGGLCVLGVTSRVFGLHIWSDFLTSLARTGRLSNKLGVYPGEMINLRGVLTLWLGDQQPTLISTLSWSGFLFSLAAMAWLWRRSLSPEDPIYDLKLALGLTLGYFFSFHLNPHDGLLLAMPLLLLARAFHLKRDSVPTEMAIIGLIPTGLLVFDFLIRDALKIRGGALLMLGLVLWLVTVLRTRSVEARFAHEPVT